MVSDRYGMGRIDGKGREKSKVFFCAIYPRAYYVRLEADGMEYLIRVRYSKHCLFHSSSFRKVA